MKIVRPEFLKAMRGPGRCDLCGKSCQARECHHLIAKGMGGGRQLDIRINILSLGSTPGFECECHSKADSSRGRMLCQGAMQERERIPYSDIEDACRFILRIPKGLSTERIKEMIVKECDDTVGALVMRSLLEARIL